MEKIKYFHKTNISLLIKLLFVVPNYWSITVRTKPNFVGNEGNKFGREDILHKAFFHHYTKDQKAVAITNDSIYL